MSVYAVKVEESRPPTDGKPSAGPVYRCIYAKDGLMELPAGMDSPWDFFRYDMRINFVYIILHFLCKLNLFRNIYQLLDIF